MKTLKVLARSFIALVAAFMLISFLVLVRDIVGSWGEVLKAGLGFILVLTPVITVVTLFLIAWHLWTH